MGARLRVFLTQQQDKTLLKLRTAAVPQKVKDRAEVIRLNAHGWYVEKIAAHFNPLLSLSAKNNQERLEHKTFTKNPDFSHSVRK